MINPLLGSEMMEGLRVEPWLEKMSENFPGGFISPPGTNEIHGPGERVKDPKNPNHTFFHNIGCIQQMVAGLHHPYPSAITRSILS